MRQGLGTAILFFSRSYVIDAKAKNLLKGKGRSKNAQMTKALATRALQCARQSGLPVYQIDEQQQVGDTFGERISNAFQAVFSKGYDAVICIGNDAASLDHVNWDGLSRSLSNGENVIGPDFRNGAYLIGLTYKSFKKGQFQNLRWQTKHLISDLKDFCQVFGELEQVGDLNDWTDLRLISRSIASIRRLLASICHSDFITDLRILFFCFDCQVNVGLRAPPKALSI